MSVENLDPPPFVQYNGHIEIRETRQFRTWIDGLRDRAARVRIDDRLKRLANGNAGDAKAVGSGVMELRFHFGSGYRVYYIWQGRAFR